MSSEHYNSTKPTKKAQNQITDIAKALGTDEAAFALRVRQNVLHGIGAQGVVQRHGNHVLVVAGNLTQHPLVAVLGVETQAILSLEPQDTQTTRQVADGLVCLPESDELEGTLAVLAPPKAGSRGFQAGSNPGGLDPKYNSTHANTEAQSCKLCT